MTTDGTDAAGRAARLAALRQRSGGRTTPSPRAARPAHPDTRIASSESATADTAGPRRGRRRHAAARARIVVAGISAGAAVALMGAMAQATDDGATSAAPAAPPAVVVMSRPAGTTSAVATPVAPRVVRTSAPPVATSRGS